MVEPFDAFVVMGAELILIGFFLLFLKVKREKTYSKVIRLFCACALVLLYAYEISIDISMGKQETSKEVSFFM